MVQSAPELASTIPGAGFAVVVRVRSFRTFRDAAAFPLRPLTLLYGHNQAGKSSLLRLLPLLADSLHGGAAALDLDSPALCGASFKELGWMGIEPQLSPWIEVAASPARDAATLILQLVDDGGPVVNAVRLRRGDAETLDVSLDGAARRERDLIRAPYAGRLRGQAWHGELSFRRLLPDGLPPDAASIAAEVERALGPLARTQWLHANRLADGQRNGAPRRGQRADGADLAPILSDPRHRVVLRSASRWLRDSDLADEITIGPDAQGQPRFVLALRGKEGLPLHLAGEGVRALVPILLHAAWAERGVSDPGSTAPTALAIEEPEAHLHPNLQVALFQRLLHTVRAGVPVVLETHSVYVLRAMQVAVLRGDFRASDVRLAWVEQSSDGAASLRPVDVRDDATLVDWQPGTFEVEQELAHEILDLRWNRGEAP